MTTTLPAAPRFQRLKAALTPVLLVVAVGGLAAALLLPSPF